MLQVKLFALKLHYAILQFKFNFNWIVFLFSIQLLFIKFKIKKMFYQLEYLFDMELHDLKQDYKNFCNTFLKPNRCYVVKCFDNNRKFSHSFITDKRINLDYFIEQNVIAINDIRESQHRVIYYCDYIHSYKQVSKDTFEQEIRNMYFTISKKYYWIKKPVFTL
jgi:hypothetical protein